MAVRDVFDGEYFDWYQVTFNGGILAERESDINDKSSITVKEFLSGDQDRIAASASKLIEDIKKNWPESVVEHCAPRVKQYGAGANVVRGSQTICHVCWGGCNAGVHLISTGGISHDVAMWLQSDESGYAMTYAVSRADVKIDMVDPAAWEYLYGGASEFAIKNKLTTSCVGDWLEAKKGRTFYIGSAKSVVQVRIYEKGIKEGGDPNWVRFEAQIRPPKADQKKMVAPMPPNHFFVSASRWLSRLYSHLLLEEHGRPERYLGTVWKRSDRESSIAAMAKQYKNTMMSFADELGGWDKLGEFLGVLSEVVSENDNQIGGFGENPYERALNRSKLDVDLNTGEVFKDAV